MRPCKALTPKGRVLLWFTQQLVRFLSLFVKIPKTKPLIFEENPLTLSKKELLFFAHKYYVKNISSGNDEGYLKVLDNKKEYHSNIAEEIKVNIGGDLMPYYFIQHNYCKELWTERSSFFQADIIAANLETPLDREKKPQLVPEVMLGNMLFNASEEQFHHFNGNDQYKGFDVLSLANNHTLDMGEDGMRQTHAFLKEQKIKSCGVGLEKKRHTIIEKEGIKVGFISWTYSLNHLKPNLDTLFNVNHLPLNKVNGCDITPIITEARMVREEGADFIIAMIHCGNAYQPYPGEQTQLIFERIAQETEVNFIVGGHPHNIQPIQEFKTAKGPVVAAYSLGDFIAYDIYQRCHLSLYLELNLAKINQQIELINFKVHRNYMEYKNKELRLRNFDDVLKESGSDKKIADLQQLYEQTISGCRK